MSKDNKNDKKIYDDVQKVFAQRYANERIKRGDSFLAALYNLSLPVAALSSEQKKGLARVVWLFYEFPPTNLSEPVVHDNNRPPGFSFPDGFIIHDDMMGYGVQDESGIYQPSEEEWWNSDDFNAFQNSYQHLCGLVESGIEGEHYRDFRRDNLQWLDSKISQLVHFSIQLAFKHPVFMVPSQGGTLKPAESPPNFRPPIIRLASIDNAEPPPDGCVSAYLDFPRTGGAWLFRQFEDGTIPLSQFSPVIVNTIEPNTPPSDRILYQTYLELLAVINNQLKFKRCRAKSTKQRSACQNIFRVRNQRGPDKIWCSDRCRRRLYEHERKVRIERKKGK